MLRLARIESILLFLTLLFLPTQLGKHFWPQFSYVYSLTIDYLSPTIYFWDLLAVSLVSVFILQRKTIKKSALNLYLLFILANVLSLFPFTGLSINFGAGLVRLEQFLIAGLFGVYLASLDVKKNKNVFFASLLISVFFQAALALGQFLSRGTLGFWVFGERTFSISTPAIAKFDFQGTEFLRPYGTFPHPNVLAAFLLIALPLLFIFFNMIKPQKVKTAFRVAVIATVSAVFLTASRTGIVAGFFASLFLFPRKIFVWILFLAGIASPFLYTRFSSIFNFDSLALLRREQLGGVALQLFLKNPLLGVGVNNFIPAGSTQLLVGPNRFLQPVHNIFLLSASETGILGLIFLITLIGFPIRRLIKAMDSFPAKVLVIVWIIIIFLGLFDHYFLTLPQGYRMLFLVWGLSFGLFNEVRSS